MYSGNNPSALRSMDWIRNALLQLLEEKNYPQISVKEICRQADLSRQTFYQLFTAKEEVMEYHFSVLFTEFAKECDTRTTITVLELARCFFRFFYEQRQFINILISNNLIYLLEQQFEIYLTKIDLFLQFNTKETYRDYTTAYMAGALTQILIHWFRQSYSLNIEELSQVTESIITGRHFAIQ